MTTKKTTALRVCFSDGVTAVLFTETKSSNAFGTVVDESDNAVAPVFVHFTHGQRPAVECEVYRFEKGSTKEYEYIASITQCEVRAREAAYIVPESIKSEVGGLWKFGNSFMRKCLQFVYGY